MEIIINILNSFEIQSIIKLLSWIGFLGAGTILRDGFNVKGLTSASTLLAVTCIGLCVGAGYYLCAIIATALVYIILSYSHLISDKVEHYNIIELEISLSKDNSNTINKIKKFLIEREVEITQIDMSTYESDNIIKIIGKDKRKSEHSLVSELIEFEDVIQVQQIWYNLYNKHIKERDNSCLIKKRKKKKWY